MDTAVALVQNYLYLNGYFTVTEYPVFELLDSGDVRTVTDLDVLAVRFPGAGARDPDDPMRRAIPLDPALDIDPDRVDLIIAEVKEGRAELNESAMSRQVLEAALRRFGRMEQDDADDLISQLHDKGSADHPAGARVRLMAFGSRPPWQEPVVYQWLLMGHVVSYIRRVLDENWTSLRAVQSKDPVLAQMILVEKALRGEH